MKKIIQYRVREVYGSPHMKNLYTLTLENNGKIRLVKVAGNSLLHALKRLSDGLKPNDVLKNFSCISLPW
jgi:flagellar biogenesis protein FliO